MTPEQALAERLSEICSRESWGVHDLAREALAFARQIVKKNRRHTELSPGVGERVQAYGLAVCDDILRDLGGDDGP